MDISKIKDLKDLQSILDLMGRYDLVELEIEGDGQKVRLRKAEPSGQRGIIGYAAPFPMATMPIGPAETGGSSQATAQPGSPASSPPAHKEVTSPMVGTFYRAPSPEAEPYAREGDVVNPDTILCIIEAMKVMNEIPAGVSGVVREILVRNGESVEFGQPLFRIESE